MLRYVLRSATATGCRSRLFQQVRCRSGARSLLSRAASDIDSIGRHMEFSFV